MNPFSVIEDFESVICAYTGAPYAVAVNSCTNALFLAMMWYQHRNKSPLDRFGPVNVFVPKRTYVSVPMQVIHAGMFPRFSDIEWEGAYELLPLKVWDCARRFRAAMYCPGAFQCVSFHWTKPLGIQHGGAILHDSPEADEWLRRARFDGRLPGEGPEKATMIGWHMLTTPEVAAAGLVRLANLPYDNPDSPKPKYPDLSQMEIFK